MALTVDEHRIVHFNAAGALADLGEVGIRRLRERDWAGQDADMLAVFASENGCPELLEVINHDWDPDTWFACYLDKAAALEWVGENHPALYARWVRHRLI